MAGTGLWDYEVPGQMVNHMDFVDWIGGYIRMEWELRKLWKSYLVFIDGYNYGFIGREAERAGCDPGLLRERLRQNPKKHGILVGSIVGFD